jgi:membrane protein involved in colicin uptake
MADKDDKAAAEKAAAEQAAAADKAAALVAVRLSFFYGDAAPGDIVKVDGKEADRLIGLGARIAPETPADQG